jgi:hypothetical protein
MLPERRLQTRASAGWVSYLSVKLTFIETVHARDVTRSSGLFSWSSASQRFNRPVSTRSSVVSNIADDRNDEMTFAYRGSTVSLGRPSVVSPLQHHSGKFSPQTPASVNGSRAECDGSRRESTGSNNSSIELSYRLDSTGSSKAIPEGEVISASFGLSSQDAHL